MLLVSFVDRLAEAAPDYAAFAAGIAVYGLLVNLFYQIISKRIMFLGRRGEAIEQQADAALEEAEAAAEAVKEAAAEAKDVLADAKKGDVTAQQLAEAKAAVREAREETVAARAEAHEAVAKAERMRMAKGWKGWMHLFLFPMVAFAYFLLLSGALLFLAGDQRSPQTIFTLAVGIIAAVRVTAYVSEPTSHDLAKMLPLGLLGVFLVDAEIVGFFTALSRMEAMLDNVEVIASLLVLTVVLEYTLRLVYQTGRRIKRRAWRQG